MKIADIFVSLGVKADNKIIDHDKKQNLKKTPDVCSNCKKTKGICTHAWLVQWHARQVKLNQMPFWSFNFKKYM